MPTRTLHVKKRPYRHTPKTRQPMSKSKLYTGTGDLGTTSLVGGQRVKKHCTRLDAYGTVDEFSSFLGIVLSHPDCPPAERANLLEVQNMLFNIGGYLACSHDTSGGAASWGLSPDDITAVESWIDRLDADTPKVNAFVLPGGTPLSAHTHVARAVCRRAERRILALAEMEPVDREVLIYFNRLSDYLFILARNFNHVAGVPEITWHKKS